MPIFGISGDDLGVGVTTQSRGKSPLLRAKRGAPGCNDRGCGIEPQVKETMQKQIDINNRRKGSPRRASDPFLGVGVNSTIVSTALGSPPEQLL